MDPAGNAFFLLGIGYKRKDTLTENGYYIGKAIRVEGYGTPRINEYGMRFILKVKNIAIFDSDIKKH